MTTKNQFTLGPILFLGSGETLPSSGKAYEQIVKALDIQPVISILETPAGFELNSEKVASCVGNYLLKRLQNYQTKVQIIPARRMGSTFSPDNPEILAPMLTSNLIFMGPGSPTYAVKQLTNSLAYQYMCAMHSRGTALCFASAAVLAVSAFTLPVYEIYKVGEDPHWVKGLDYFSHFGLKIVFIPHWNNQDGGDELDTSRCFMGKDRFERLKALLPVDAIVVGIDEQTSLYLDFNPPNLCSVFGKGIVTISCQNKDIVIPSGKDFPINLLGNFFIPDPGDYIKPDVWQLVNQSAIIQNPNPTIKVKQLMDLREIARNRNDWAEADRLRAEINQLGWQVNDTPQGPELGVIDINGHTNER